MVKNLPAVQVSQEARIQSPGQEDLLEEGMATHSSFLPGKSHGQRRLGGYPRGFREPDMMEVTEHTHRDLNCIHYIVQKLNI